MTLDDNDFINLQQGHTWCKLFYSVLEYRGVLRKNVVPQPLVPKRMWAGFEERNPTTQAEKTTAIMPIFVASTTKPENHIALKQVPLTRGSPPPFLYFTEINIQ